MNDLFELEQQNAPLLKAVQKYLQVNHAPFYMPGHKRGQSIDREFQALLGENLFKLDLPELPGLDEAIAEAEELAAAAYGSDRTWFLVNGSTCGIQAMMLAVLSPGDKILIGRNCHKAAIAALVLCGAMPKYLPTDYQSQLHLDLGVSPETLKKYLLIHPDAKAVMLVSPNYYGVCGELAQLATICHAHNVPLLVDAAHGAHLGFHPSLPISAIESGADLVVHSTHKMLSGLTQASMLHCQGKLVETTRVNQAVQLVQSTSPNLLLLTSLDVARRQIVIHGEELLTQTIELVNTARSQINRIPNLFSFGITEVSTLDPTRLTVKVDELGITGFDIDRIFYTKFDVMAEMPTLQNLVFIFSIGNTESDVAKLISAFEQLSFLYCSSPHAIAEKHLVLSQLSQAIAQSIPVQKLTPREAFFSQCDPVSINNSIGRISSELICPYPPGIPVICPGEVITAEIIDFLQQILEAGGIINGCSDPSFETIKVVRNEGI